MRKPVIGICSLCCTRGPLSDEHVPPQAANNKREVTKWQAESITASRQDSKRVAVLQGGYSTYSLCQKCNNDTGGWYGREYVNWTRIGTGFLQKLSVVKEGELS